MIDYVEGKKTNAESPHENGDVEQRHFRFKKAPRSGTDA